MAHLGWAADTTARPPRSCARSVFARSRPGSAVRSEEELRGILAEAEETGIIEEAEEEMLDKVFDFADTEVREVMVTRPHIAALSAEMPMKECLAVVFDSPYTLHPVYRARSTT